MTDVDKRRVRLAAVKQAEDAGMVADSLDVRIALIERMNKGELTLKDVQQQLKKIKANAKKNGQITRTQAYLRG